MVQDKRGKELRRRLRNEKRRYLFERQKEILESRIQLKVRKIRHEMNFLRSLKQDGQEKKKTKNELLEEIQQRERIIESWDLQAEEIRQLNQQLQELKERNALTQSNLESSDLIQEEEEEEEEEEDEETLNSSIELNFKQAGVPQQPSTQQKRLSKFDQLEIIQEEKADHAHLNNKILEVQLR